MRPSLGRAANRLGFMFRKNSGPYSFRSSSLSDFFAEFFFIEFAFERSSSSGVDQPNHVGAFRKGYKKNPTGVGSPDDDLTLFTN